jgi:hypothetical protein
VDVRLLATAKVDLREEVQQGCRRADFFHRIAVLSLVVPPPARAPRGSAAAGCPLPQAGRRTQPRPRPAGTR